MKKVQLESWNTFDKLCLISSVCKLKQTIGDQNWVAISRHTKQLNDTIGHLIDMEKRSDEWFSVKQCAAQYEHIMKTSGIRRKKRMDRPGVDTLETIEVSLRHELKEEIKKSLIDVREEYLKTKKIVEDVDNNRLNQEQLEDLIQECDGVDIKSKLKSMLDVKNAENDSAKLTNIFSSTLGPELPPPPPPPAPEIKTSSTTSPLLTSLLQSPSPLRPSLPSTSSPTITLLLHSSPAVPMIDSALSKLLETTSSMQNLPSTSNSVSLAISSPSSQQPSESNIKNVIEEKTIVIEKIDNEKIDDGTVIVEELTDIEHDIVESEIIIEHESPPAKKRKLDVEVEIIEDEDDAIETEESVLETVEEMIERVEEAIIETVGESSLVELTQELSQSDISNEPITIDADLEHLEIGQDETVEVIVLPPDLGSDSSAILSNEAVIISRRKPVKISDETVVIDDSQLKITNDTVVIDDSLGKLSENTIVITDSAVKIDDQTVVIDDSDIKINNNTVILGETPLKISGDTVVLSDTSLKISGETVVIEDDITTEETVIIEDTSDSEDERSDENSFESVQMKESSRNLSSEPIILDETIVIDSSEITTHKELDLENTSDSLPIRNDPPEKVDYSPQESPSIDSSYDKTSADADICTDSVEIVSESTVINNSYLKNGPPDITMSSNQPIMEASIIKNDESTIYMNEPMICTNESAICANQPTICDNESTVSSDQSANEFNEASGGMVNKTISTTLVSDSTIGSVTISTDKSLEEIKKSTTSISVIEFIESPLSDIQNSSATISANDSDIPIQIQTPEIVDISITSTVQSLNEASELAVSSDQTNISTILANQPQNDDPAVVSDSTLSATDSTLPIEIGTISTDKTIKENTKSTHENQSFNESTSLVSQQYVNVTVAPDQEIVLSDDNDYNELSDQQIESEDESHCSNQSEDHSTVKDDKGLEIETVVIDDSSDENTNDSQKNDNVDELSSKESESTTAQSPRAVTPKKKDFDKYHCVVALTPCKSSKITDALEQESNNDEEDDDFHSLESEPSSPIKTKKSNDAEIIELSNPSISSDDSKDAVSTEKNSFTISDSNNEQSCDKTPPREIEVVPLEQYGPKDKSSSRKRNNSASSVESEEELRPRPRSFVPSPKRKKEIKYGQVVSQCFVSVSPVSFAEVRNRSEKYIKEAKAKEEISKQKFKHKESEKTKISRSKKSTTNVIDAKPDSPSLSTASSEEDRDLRAWKKSIMLVFNRLASHKFASVFSKPITDNEAPGYHDLILRPMDLSTIKKNIENGIVRTTVEFQRDLLLMVQNAIMYNKIDTHYYDMALQMGKDMLAEMQIMVMAIGDGVPLLNSCNEEKSTRGRVNKSVPERKVDEGRSAKRKRTISS